ncbi:uncharacterized protein LY79DRAFT_143649 [Colletotrichum navitas]|uniref:Uncharacterized protein n=1 Tax=Colletotrichum navitas TaxID=681940 RepID=A0AAD8QBG8_9PEZI|nr:uncharacterized protein LY79DRAFT_143649 [Colletotrichum navitas]KAK1599535.1 hypothetical protein LY79DRAFT_143649 [Colletotrichum navitas]
MIGLSHSDNSFTIPLPPGPPGLRGKRCGTVSRSSIRRQTRLPIIDSFIDSRTCRIMAPSPSPFPFTPNDTVRIVGRTMRWDGMGRGQDAPAPIIGCDCCCTYVSQPTSMTAHLAITTSHAAPRALPSGTGWRRKHLLLGAPWCLLPARETIHRGHSSAPLERGKRQKKNKGGAPSMWISIISHSRWRGGTSVAGINFSRLPRWSRPSGARRETLNCIRRQKVLRDPPPSEQKSDCGDGRPGWMGGPAYLGRDMPTTVLESHLQGSRGGMRL